MFFLPKIEYFSCEQLERGITFGVKGLYHCCPYLNANETYPPVQQLTGNVISDYKMFFNKKREEIKNSKKGKHSERCKQCYFLKKKYWQQDNKITKINIFANKTCSADCIYCSSHSNKKYYNSIQDAPVYSYIEYLIKENKISENCNVLFAGGEPTLHYEFEKNMQLLLKTRAFIRINTSAIEYSPIIEEAIQLGNCSIVISIDSGSNELYKKIKNVDKFNVVSQNISKYCKSQLNSYFDKQVILKYIVIPNINDKEEYIIEFYKLAKDVGCKVVCLDIENYWCMKNTKENIQKKVNEINSYKNRSKEFSLKCL